MGETVTVDVEMEPSKETELPEVRKESPVVSSESTTNNDRKEDQDQVKINTADADTKPGKAEMIEKTGKTEKTEKKKIRKDRKARKAREGGKDRRKGGKDPRKGREDDGTERQQIATFRAGGKER